MTVGAGDASFRRGLLGVGAGPDGPRSPDALGLLGCGVNGLFAVSGAGGIKVRLRPYEHFLNVDGHRHFVHVFASVMQGRTTEQKKALSERVVRALKALLPEVAIISMNVWEFERTTYCNVPMIEAGGPVG